MVEYYNSDDIKNNVELNLYHCGREACEKGHSYGPTVRDHYLIHYILSGKGFFKDGKKVYNLNAGQGFLICPGVITYYQADNNDPWNYTWVGFNGFKAELYLKQAGISSENPIFKYNKDDAVKVCFEQMIQAFSLKKSRETRLIGCLYMFLSKLMEQTDSDLYMDKNTKLQEQYVSKAINFIRMNYSKKITIAEISANLGLDRKYFSEIFKNFMDMSPKEYLINYRIDRACELLGNTGLSIGEIANMVGYEDALLFSKIFKKYKMLSPRYFVQKLK